MAENERFVTRAAVFVVLHDDQGRIFLQQRAGTGYLDGYWDLPSGHLERGESLPAAAARELLEETGVTVALKDLRLITIDHYAVERNYLNFVFVASAWQGTPEVREPDKCSAVGWFAPDALPEHCTNVVRVVARQEFDGGLEFTVTDRQAYEKLLGSPAVAQPDKAVKFEFAVADCLVERDGKFLIIQEGKPGRNGLYNIPGGHIEASETIAEAVVREVLEESGYQVELTGFIGLYQSVYPDRRLNVCGPTFLGHVVGGEARISAEHPEVRWVNAEEFLHMAESGGFWTNYLGQLMQDYARRGAYPLDAVDSVRY